MSDSFETSPGFERLEPAMRGTVNLPKAEVQRITTEVRSPKRKTTKKLKVGI
jgi:hypothetical protein